MTYEELITALRRDAKTLADKGEFMFAVIATRLSDAADAIEKLLEER